LHRISVLLFNIVRADEIVHYTVNHAIADSFGLDSEKGNCARDKETTQKKLLFESFDPNIRDATTVVRCC